MAEKKQFNAKRRQKTLERPQNAHFGEVKNNPLLNKWENQYGGIKNRQFYVKSDHDYDAWHVDNNKQKFTSFNQPDNYDDNIVEEIPDDPQPKVYIQNPLLNKKQNKLEGSSSHREFEYDWDEEESMSYLKKFNDENLKENYNKYGQKISASNAPKPIASEYNDKKKTKEPKQKKSGMSKMKTDRVNPRHFKSVAPQIDDWDD